MELINIHNHIITCDNLDTSNYLVGTGLLHHCIDGINNGSFKDESIIYFDIDKAKTYFNIMHGINCNEYHEIKLQQKQVVENEINIKSNRSVITKEAIYKIVEDFYNEQQDYLVKYANYKINRYEIYHLSGEDLVQEASVRLLSKNHVVRVNNLFAYTKRIIQNLIIDEVRKNTSNITKQRINFISYDNHNDFIENESDDFYLHLGDNTIELSLPSFAYQHWIFGYSIKEIAIMEKLSVRTINYKLNKIRNNLKII